MVSSKEWQLAELKKQKDKQDEEDMKANRRKIKLQVKEEKEKLKDEKAKLKEQRAIQNEQNKNNRATNVKKSGKKESAPKLGMKSTVRKKNLAGNNVRVHKQKLEDSLVSEVIQDICDQDTSLLNDKISGGLCFICANHITVGIKCDKCTKAFHVKCAEAKTDIATNLYICVSCTKNKI